MVVLLITFKTIVKLEGLIMSPRSKRYVLKDKLKELHKEEPLLLAEIYITTLLPNKQAAATLKKWNGESLDPNEKGNLNISKNKAQAWCEFVKLLEENEELEDLRSILLESK